MMIFFTSPLSLLLTHLHCPSDLNMNFSNNPIYHRLDFSCYLVPLEGTQSVSLCRSRISNFWYYHFHYHKNYDTSSYTQQSSWLKEKRGHPTQIGASYTCKCIFFCCVFLPSFYFVWINNFTILQNCHFKAGKTWSRSKTPKTVEVISNDLQITS